MAAVTAYQSQFKPERGRFSTAISQGSFLRFIEAQAVVFGAMIGASYGEAFYLSGPVALHGLPGLEDTPPSIPGELPPYRVF